MFYLVTIVLAAIIILFIIKYQVIPVINRRESTFKKIIRHVLDTLIAFLIAAIAIASVLFWMSGNE
jgi:hypothetical protein